MSDNVFEDFLDRYGVSAGEEGPVLLAQEVFGKDLDPWQEKAIRAYGRGDRRISIRACHGPGKTFVAAVCIWHQLICRFPQKTKATAPSKGQLEDALVAEVLSLGATLPTPIKNLFEFKKNRIELKAAKDDSFFSAGTAREEKPEALQGVHCDLGWVLLVADEASGIAEAIFEAAAGSMSGHRATTLLLSNPVRGTGFFFDTHNKLRDMWTTFHVSHEDSPRVSDDFVYDIERRYGPDSNAFRIRCLGEFPLADLDAIIPAAHVFSAQERDVEIPKNVVEVWGVDIARKGDDKCTIVRRNKLGVNPLIAVWGKKDLMYTAGRIKRAYDECLPSERPQSIIIDANGMGAGVADRLSEQGLPVLSINVSETASSSEQYANVRAELWYLCAEWLETKDHWLPKRCACKECVREPQGDHVQMMVEEMIAQKGGFTSGGKMLAKPKEETKKDLKRSPNIADGLMLTFADEIAALLHGSDDVSGFGWNTEVERDISYV